MVMKNGKELTALYVLALKVQLGLLRILYVIMMHILGSNVLIVGSVIVILGNVHVLMGLKEWHVKD